MRNHTQRIFYANYTACSPDLVASGRFADVALQFELGLLSGWWPWSSVAHPDHRHGHGTGLKLPASTVRWTCRSEGMSACLET